MMLLLLKPTMFKLPAAAAFGPVAPPASLLPLLPMRATSLEAWCCAASSASTEGSGEKAPNAAAFGDGEIGAVCFESPAAPAAAPPPPAVDAIDAVAPAPP